MDLRRFVKVKPAMNSINDLHRLRGDIKDAIHKAVADCIDSGWYILGRNVAEFEHEFAEYIGTDFCIAVANGTQALELALRSADIKENDEVVTTANAGFYSTCAIMACGSAPVYADININDYTMDPISLGTIITEKTKAVILTHLYGKIGNVSAISKICSTNGIRLIEDCAQAHGAEKYDKKAGSFGDCACFSFYPTKNLGAMGDGGAITTSSAGLAEKIRQLRQYGWNKKYIVDVPSGTNSRLDEMQAAILRVKLRYLDEWNERRREIAARYGNGISHAAIIAVPQEFSGDYVAHLYTVRTKYRDSLMGHLKTIGIPTDIHYPVPDYRQKPLAAQFAQVTLPVTEEVCSQVLTLPCFPEMTTAETDLVIAAINNWRAP